MVCRLYRPANQGELFKPYDYGGNWNTYASTINIKN